MSNLTSREMLARQIVSPTANYGEAAQTLAAAFLAGRKTPEEVQLEAAKNALAQDQLVQFQQKQMQAAALNQANASLQNTFNAPHVDAAGNEINLVNFLSSPAGAEALRNTATQYVKGGGDIGKFLETTRAMGSFSALDPKSGVTDAVIQRLAGSPAIGENQALSIGGQNAIASRNAGLDVWKAQQTAPIDIAKANAIADHNANLDIQKQAALENQKMAIEKAPGQNQVNYMIDQLYNNYDALNKTGKTVNTLNSGEQNLVARISNLPPVQAIAGAFGTPEQTLRDEIKAQQPLLLNAIRQATGMSAKALDSDKDVQMYMQTVTNPNSSIQANIDALNRIKILFGAGGPKLAQPTSTADANNRGYAVPKTSATAPVTSPAAQSSKPNAAGIVFLGFE